MAKDHKRGVTVAVVACLLVAYEYPLWRFHGDAWIGGGPGFGYSIKMQRIPLNKAGDYVFHFRGIPNGKMSLLLYVEGNMDAEKLAHLNVTLDALLVDQNGQATCQGSGMPGEGQNEHIWVVNSSGGLGIAFWHWNCVHMTLKSSASYTLTLRVRNPDPNTPEIIVKPVLESDHAVWP